MAILNAGTSIAEFPEGTGAHTTGNNLANNVNEGVRIADINGATIWEGSPEAEVWVTYHTYRINTTPTADRTIFRNGGEDFLKHAFSDSENRLLYWDGSAWVELFSFSEFTTATTRIDIQVKLHATDGAIRFYRNKILEGEFVGNTIFNSVTTLDSVAIGRYNTSTNAHSAIIVATEDTRPLVYAQLLPSGAGSLTEWTGDASNVSGSTSFSDSTFMSTDLAEQKQTFTLPNLHSSFETGWTIETLFVAARARRDPDTVADLRIMALSGADEAFGTQVSLTNDVEVVNHQFTVDPATDAAWTIAGVNALEIGVQSRAPA